MKKEIRQVTSSELIGALDLAWDTFSESAAEDCTQDGIEEFWRSCDHEYMQNRTGDGACRVWGAFEDGQMAGMCVMREPCHIEMLFVMPEAQRRGVGSSLLKRAVMDARRADETVTRVTVNSFPGALGFFKKMGFSELGGEMTDEDIPFAPMAAEGGKDGK